MCRSAEDERAVEEFFQKWLGQPASEDLPTAPELLSGSQVTMHSPVLGCDIQAVASNDFRSISVAEHVLAALKALLATSLQDVFPHAQQFTVEIAASPDVRGEPQCRFEEGSYGQKVLIRHSKSTGKEFLGMKPGLGERLTSPNR